MADLPPPEPLLFAVREALTNPQYEPGAPIMADIVHLQPRDQWQFSCDIVRKPDGKLVAVLTDARGSLLEAEPTEQLTAFAKMIEESVAGMRATAQAVKS